MDILVAHAVAEARAALVGGLAGTGMTVLEAADGETACRRLCRADGPFLGILDWDLPVAGGLDVCRRVRAATPPEAPYLIVLTAAAHGHDVSEAAVAGADDFVLAPVGGDELRARAAFARAVLEARSAAPGAADDERQLRCFDPVTGLGERGQLIRRLEEELARSRRERSTLGVGILDVDGLGPINEQHGRAVGDAVLAELARRLEGALRPYDVVGRLQGDEFLIITPRTGEYDIADALGRVREAVAARPFCHGEQCLEVTVALGGVTGSEESAEELIEMARPVLGEAKEAGGDRVVAGVKAVLEPVISNQWSI